MKSIIAALVVLAVVFSGCETVSNVSDSATADNSKSMSGKGNVGGDDISGNTVKGNFSVNKSKK